ncbi:hypothetical protein L288_13980 [Sphingobium quisquiliarum P25]|uniref:Uncharacterized protein n=1 Tax=Sphingobium quisquiliarum P25 TaxID=1329909 RepID=T0HYQ3_9SPHN|nr:hypothetical protein L288_13980 [Sphingobium quisquiliarum P25]
MKRSRSELFDLIYEPVDRADAFSQIDRILAA